uniref:Uncharacterized protein n=1 Tax=Heterorhabditis bacteriophora TaxID=37862 RepID=A0A1I7WVW3_HETBA
MGKVGNSMQIKRKFIRKRIQNGAGKHYDLVCAGGGFEFGVDPEDDPDLALLLFPLTGLRHHKKKEWMSKMEPKKKRRRSNLTELKNCCFISIYVFYF